MYKIKMTPEAKIHYGEMYKHGKDSGSALTKTGGAAKAAFQQWGRKQQQPIRISNL